MCTFCVRWNTSVAAGPKAASSRRPLATRSCSVSATARGCSWISLSMKCRYCPFSAASADSSLSRTARSAVLPSRSMTRTLSRRTSATSPSSRKMKRRVTGSSAATSEATKFSSTPRPMTTGQPSRARIRRSGSCSLTTASA